MTDLPSLTALVQANYNDIRSCLFALQLGSFGIKDVSTSYIDTMNMIMSSTAGASSSIYTASTTTVMTPEKLISTAYSADNSPGCELIRMGCYENMYSVPYMDHDLKLTCNLLNSLIAADAMTTVAMETQDHDVLAYAPYCILDFYNTLNATVLPKIEFPTSFGKYIKSSKSNKSVSASLTYGAVPYISMCHTQSRIILDMGSLLCRCLSPCLVKKHDMHSLSSHERAVACDAIGAAYCYGVHYAQPDNSHYVYDPPIHNLLLFVDENWTLENVLGRNVCQMFAQQINSETIRQSCAKSTDEQSSHEVLLLHVSNMRRVMPVVTVADTAVHHKKTRTTLGLFKSQPQALNLTAAAAHKDVGLSTWKSRSMTTKKREVVDLTPPNPNKKPVLGMYITLHNYYD